MKLHYFQHIPFEDPAKIKDWAISNNFQISSTKFYNDYKKIDIDSIDFLMIMGGPMNIYEYDKYPWLKEEKIMIEKFIKKGKFVLGICLGAQLIANVLGEKVFKNKYKEIGWFPVNFIKKQDHILDNVLPYTINVFQWHQDTFDIPLGATKLASSEICSNQAFIYENKVIGLQFHIESTMDSIKNLIKFCRNEIKNEQFIQEEKTILNHTKSYQKNANFLLYDILDTIKKTFNY